LNGIIYLFRFFEEAGRQERGSLAGMTGGRRRLALALGGSQFAGLYRTFLAGTALACKTAVGRCSAANK